MAYFKRVKILSPFSVAPGFSGVVLIKFVKIKAKFSKNTFLK
jgi:hypothetical protein